jgi:DNA-binding response OmpR family regulator
MSPATKVLIVEDEDTLANNLKSFLGRVSPNVMIAGDAFSAIEILQSFTPDIVVLDYGLPGMDGIQTYTRILQKMVPLARCIMISGYPADYLTRTSLEYGIQHSLLKPFTLSELQEMIDLSLNEIIKITSSLQPSKPTVQ